LKTKEIFQDGLLAYSGTVVIVSHDRFFLDRHVNRVIEIRNGQCYEYHGNYSYFIQKRSEIDAAVPGGGDENNSQKGVGSIQTGRLSVAEQLSGSRESTAGRKAFKTKEEKRLEAEERNRLSRITKALKNEIVMLEDRISSLEERKAENENILCAPDIHREPLKVKRLNQELLDMERELGKLYISWEDIIKKLEACQ
jgi:ATP-binding cassette subfamily F protein 3